MVVDYLDHLFPMCQFYVHKEATIRNAISTLERIQTFHVTEKISLLHLNTKAKDVSNLQKRVLCIVESCNRCSNLKWKKGSNHRIDGSTTWLLEGAIEHPSNLVLKLRHTTP